MKIWLVVSIVLTVLLFMALRWAKAHDTTDGDMGDALLTMAFLVLMIVNWGCLEFTAAYRWLNGGGA